MTNLLKSIWRISVKTWLCLFIASSLICVFSLRHNNQTMVKLRDAVNAADKSNGDVNTALNNLRAYVYAHMNTNLSTGNGGIKPPIQLKYTYQRLYDAQQNQLQTANQQLYANAQTYCKNTGQTAFDSPCVANYVVNHGGQSADANIPAGLYEFDFVSPRWSPDLAGWSLALSVALAITLAAKLTSQRLKK